MLDNRERTAQVQARGGRQTHRTGNAIQISGRLRLTKDLRSQINKASALSECLRDIVWSIPYLRTDSKIGIYKTCIKPIMTCGTEVHEDINKTKSMLRVA